VGEEAQQASSEERDRGEESLRTGGGASRAAVC
jgi:hypothetical protein